MNAQYKKGVLELCVLSLLHLRDCYGYEISDFLSQHIEIADGTVYPATAYLDGRPAGVLFRAHRVRPADHSRLLPLKSEAIPQICSPARSVGERSLSKVGAHAPHITNDQSLSRECILQQALIVCICVSRRNWNHRWAARPPYPRRGRYRRSVLRLRRRRTALR